MTPWDTSRPVMKLQSCQARPRALLEAPSRLTTKRDASPIDDWSMTHDPRVRHRFSHFEFLGPRRRRSGAALVADPARHDIGADGLVLQPRRQFDDLRPRGAGALFHARTRALFARHQE